MIDNDGLFFVLAMVGLLGGLTGGWVLFGRDEMGLALFARRRILRDGQAAKATIVEIDDVRQRGRNLVSLRDVKMRLAITTSQQTFHCDVATFLSRADVEVLKLERWVSVRFDERQRVVLDMKSFRAQMHEQIKHQHDEARRYAYLIGTAIPWRRLPAVFLVLAVVPGLLIAIGVFRDWQCKSGNGEVCFKLGLRRELVPRKETPDPPAAVAYYRRACELSSAAGCRALGNAYRNHYGGLSHDDAMMRASYCKACKLGLAASCKAAGNDCSGP
jgi:hypothetical protein